MDRIIFASLLVVAKILIFELLATPDLTYPPGSKYKYKPHLIPPNPEVPGIVNLVLVKLFIS
ncbi:MAG: hypothetical protein PUJ51_02880 [Clostridiales bacterium]|uniref:hypothetical protein n=1 Tax=Terrisporobacter sp. TaxID=1965305 RepID=UPI002A522BDF|nr:hypothetical protein [Terrisporobacter sp.]MDD7753440.1 hypothetical protein [Clostridiales bacterium]MDY4134528.1 hypothetical protein [Terrisporobacter sp.]